MFQFGAAAALAGKAMANGAANTARTAKLTIIFFIFIFCFYFFIFGFANRLFTVQPLP
jgi:hypothetical protein